MKFNLLLKTRYKVYYHNLHRFTRQLKITFSSSYRLLGATTAGRFEEIFPYSLLLKSIVLVLQK